jgi:hypothetical protein
MRRYDVADCFFTNGAVEVTRTILNTCSCSFFACAVVSIMRCMTTFRDVFSLPGPPISLLTRLLLQLVFPGAERTQQAFEVCFVVLRVSPVFKVADMSGVLDLPGPCCATRHDSLINSYRIEHIGGALFFLECSFHFVLNPTAGKRILRQDQQQFIVPFDRLFNAVSDGISNVQILWSKPAAYTFLLDTISYFV